MATYCVGCESRLTVRFTNADGVLVDPSTVQLHVMNPSKQRTTYAAPDVVKDSTGVYHYDLALTKTGSWHYRWVGAGGVTAAAEDFLVVQKSAF
jgi:hypothetical protein